MAPKTQSITPIVDVEVLISPLAAPRLTFNQMLIVGPSTVIPTSERVRKYNTIDSMLEDGFTNQSVELIAARIHVSQSPSPDSWYIGRQDTSISPAETFLQALQACREADFNWYVCMCCNATSVAHKAIAAWVQTATPASVYAFTTHDADVLTGATSPANVFQYLKALQYNRVLGQYATNQNSQYPNNVHAVAAIMGYAMGQNSGLANSAFTLKFKEEVGISTEPLSLTQIGNIEGQNGNVYLSYGNYYNIFEQGVMANGQFFDEIINLDMLVNNIQLSVMDLLYGNPKIPQTDPGVNQIIHAINQACEQAVTIGFLAPGKWTGANVLNLHTDDMLPKGYLCQAPPVSSQSDADRQARKSPPIYVAIKEAGAIHSVLIGVYVNR